MSTREDHKRWADEFFRKKFEQKYGKDTTGSSFFYKTGFYYYGFIVP